MNFFAYEPDVTEIVLACKVLAGCGESVHRDRKSYGLAFQMDGETEYAFQEGMILTVRKNDIIFLPEHSDYVVRDLVPGDCYAINFKLREPIDAEPFVFHTKAAADYVTLFAESEKNFREMKQGFRLNGKAKLYALLYRMIGENHAEYLPKQKQERLAPAVEYMHTYYAVRNIEVDFLAQLCHMKASYFRRLFLQCYGMSPIHYINSLKITRAKNLLLQSEYAIEQVGEMAGFHNNCYFHRYFKKTVGMTPTEYKHSAEEW